MQARPTAQEREEGRHALKVCMLRNALHHTKSVGGRTAILMQKNGLLKPELPMVVPAGVAEMIANPEHEKRLPVSLGPLILVKEDDGSRSPIKVTDFIANPDLALRQAALGHFSRMIAQDSSTVTPKTAQVVDRNQSDACSLDQGKWVRAAIMIADAIGDDLLCNIAALRQSVELGFQVGYSEYLPLVLHPSLSSLDSITPPLWSLRRQRDELRSRLDACVQAESFAVALDQYYVQFGNLPLTGSFAMGEVLTRFRSRGTELWRDAWAWADSISGPLPRYHVCQAFIACPDLIPLDERERFWREVNEIVGAARSDDRSGPWTEAWRLRCALARHFSCHLETMCPGQDGERVAAFAWWLGEKVAVLFGTKSEYLRRFREGAVASALDLSSELWQMAAAVVQPSALRYATIFLRSLWSLALLAEVGRNFDALPLGELRSEIRQSLDEAICSNVFSGFKTASEQSDTEYAFEAGAAPAASQWLSLTDTGERPDKIRVFLDASEVIDDPDRLRETLARVASDSEADQALAAHAIRASVFLGAASADVVWEQLSEKAWRERVFLNAADNCIEMLADALVELQVREGGKWASYLPHYFAMACVAAPTGMERQRHLFALTVMSCLASDTVSAIQRLMHSAQLHALGPSIEHWRDRLRIVAYSAPPWLAARIRAVLASLHVS